MSRNRLEKRIEGMATDLATLAVNIRWLRAARGFTQDDLATALGIDQGSVSKLEDSKTIPSLGMVKRLALYFTLELYELTNPSFPTSVRGKAVKRQMVALRDADEKKAGR